MSTIIWFRRDLRIEDNLALSAADGCDVIPVYILEANQGRAINWYLHHALLNLEKKLGSKLNCFNGDALQILLKICSENKVNRVLWNRLYEPELIEGDSKIKRALKERNIEVVSFEGYLLSEPWKCLNLSKKPYQVFTPFWKSLLKIYQHQKPISAPSAINYIQIPSLVVSNLGLLPKLNWANGFSEYWNWQIDNDFAPQNYSQTRDLPGIKGTSRVSPALHFGEVSPRMLWEKALVGRSFASIEPYLRQLGWREFAHSLLFHFPNTVSEPLMEEFNKFPWKKNRKHILAWQQGRTGYPIVDAGMRELWATGWMHNRVRMIVGSFLVKNLLQHWHEGANWFLDTLVDADLANNTMGWQWISGCGADAAPYFRIFNPVLQGEKFDPKGSYVKKWVPELRTVPKKYIHRIWEASELAPDYPKPIVNLAESRDAALDAYQLMKELKARQ